MNKVQPIKNYAARDNFPQFESGPPVKKVAHACSRSYDEGTQFYFH